MDKIIREFKIEATKRKIKEKIDYVEDKAKQVIDWAVEHPMEALAIGSAVVGGIYKCGRLITRNREIRHERYITDCRFYDPRMGEYVFSDRKLSNNEKLRFDDLYKQGYTKREALNIMGRIKY